MDDRWGLLGWQQHDESDPRSRVSGAMSAVERMAGARPTYHPPSQPAPLDGPSPVRPPSWRRGYLLAVIAADGFGLLIGGAFAAAARFDGRPPMVLGARLQTSYAAVSVALGALWVVTLSLSRVYNVRVLGAGADEYRRILDAIIRLVAIVAGAAFFLHLNISRSFVAVVGPVAFAVTLSSHWMGRQWLHYRRRRGGCQQRAVIVGSIGHVPDLVRHLDRASHAGLRVVGACTASADTEVPVDGREVPVVAEPSGLVDWVMEGNADAVIVADASVLGLGAIRRFAWQLEGSGVDLILAPSLTGVAGPRIAIRPVEGLPLLHVEEPRFDGVTRLVKGVFERTFALVAVLCLVPVFVITGLLVRCTSRGPILYRQTRVGRAGTTFTMLKFRTMVDGADAQKESLASLNEHDGPLFKIRQDPRITRVGRWLRRYSLDELPQITHVLTGKMALVGPRPPVPSEIERYTDEAWRRLLVRPGITGLWQVSGRSELPWMETLRLDLYYVDNWSLALDAAITFKTLLAVVRGRGAY